MLTINESVAKPSFPSGTAKENVEIRLRREIGLLEAIALMVGAIIGSGIFISPKGILESVGSPGMSLVIWVLCGFIATSGALTMMEIQLSIPSSGSYYTYFFEVLGPIPGFVYLWVHTFIFGPFGFAILAVAIAQYITGAIFRDPGYPAPEASVRLIATLAIWLFIFVNCYDVRISTKLQNVFFFGKVVPLVFVFVSGVYYGVTSNSENLSHIYSFKNSTLDPGRIVFALYCGGFTYGGWDALASVTEELKNPNRNMPLALFVSIPLVTIIYVLTNAAYLIVLSESEFLSSVAIGVTYVEKLFPNYGWVMSILVSISMVGVLSINIMISSRQVFIGARNKQFLAIMGHIKQSRMTPTPAIIFLGILSLAGMITSDVFVLIDYTSYMYNWNNVGIVVVFFYLRWKQPNLARPVKVSIIHPLLFSCSTLFMIISPFFNRPIQCIVGITIGLGSIPMYFVFFNKSGVPRENPRLSIIIGKVSKLIQKLIVCLPED